MLGGKLLQVGPLQFQQRANMYGRSRIGNREVVGFGFNGQANYADRLDFPFPAVRFRENTSDIQALREKEKGDWRKLTCEEKKALYRASFCQTFSEMKAPSGKWKSMMGVVLVVMSTPLWGYMFMKKFVYDKELPPSYTQEAIDAQAKRMAILDVNPITGIATKWDHEKGQWK